MSELKAQPLQPFNEHSAMDYLPADQLRHVQRRRLEQVVAWVYERVEPYRARMEQAGVKPSDLRGLEDLARLPFTYKDDLRDHYPFGLFATGLNEIVRLHASSGTTGKPTVVAYTRQDVELWASVMCRTFAAVGVGPHDIVQNAYGYGLFTGGLGAHYGLEGIGATVIPISGGNTERQIMVMKDFGVTAICCTPSYFLHLIERAEAMGIAISELPIRVGVFGAEPWTEAMRQRVQDASGVKAMDIYGLSEIIGPGVASECCEQAGLHIFEDHFYPEVIDPDSGEVLPDGQRGELVITTLSKRAMPVIRYRTRDMTSIIPEPCGCGRTIRRIQRISARSDDMLIIRGVNVYPSQIETALLAVEGTLPHYQIILRRRNELDVMEVQVEVTEAFFSDKVRELEGLRKRLAGSIHSTTGLNADIRLVEAHTIARSEGKAKRVLDERYV